MVGAVVACSSVRRTVCDGVTAEPQETASPHACLLPGSRSGPPLASSVHYAECKAISSPVPRVPCASAARAKASWFSAQTHAPRRNPRHLVQRVDFDHRGHDLVGAVEKAAAVHTPGAPRQACPSRRSRSPRITQPVLGHVRLSEFDFEDPRDRS